jgi:hypothetical protein
MQLPLTQICKAGHGKTEEQMLTQMLLVHCWNNWQSELLVHEALKQAPLMQTNPVLQSVVTVQGAGILGRQIPLVHICNLANEQSLVDAQAFPILGMHTPRTQVCPAEQVSEKRHSWTVAGMQKPLMQVCWLRGQVPVTLQSGPLLEMHKLLMQVCWAVHETPGRHKALLLGVQLPVIQS